MITDLTRRFDVDGFELCWDQWGSGDGPPFVLCHGFSGSSHDFALRIDDFTAARRVASIDHRGHGQSSKSGDLDDYSVEKIVTDVSSWLESELDGPVDLLGHSMGGRIALRVTLERPDLVRSLILMDTTAWRFGPDDPSMSEMFTTFFESITVDTVLPEFDTPEAGLIEAATSEDWQTVKDQRDKGFDKMAMKGLGLELFHDTLTPVGDRLAEITMPVTVIAGEHDRPLVDHAPRLADAVGDGVSIVIPGAYHSPQLTHPDEWRAAVESHLERAAASG